MVLLPPLVLGTQVEGARVLEVWGQDDALIPAFSGKLDTEVPSLQCNKDKFEVFRSQMLLNKGVESADGIVESSSVTDMFPGQGG